jgi:hypothetical protein
MNIDWELKFYISNKFPVDINVWMCLVPGSHFENPWSSSANRNEDLGKNLGKGDGACFVLVAGDSGESGGTLWVYV